MKDHTEDKPPSSGALWRHLKSLRPLDGLNALGAPRPRPFARDPHRQVVPTDGETLARAALEAEGRGGRF